MQWLLMFLCYFGLVFAPASCVTFLVWYGRRVSLDSMASSVDARRYPELARFPSDERERLLLAADRQAFAGWRFAIPPLYYAAIMAAAIAAVETGREVRAPFRSIWSSFGLGMLIVLLGTFLGRRLEMGRIRRFLRLRLTDPNAKNRATP
jgi:hypothetical protein